MARTGIIDERVKAAGGEDGFAAAQKPTPGAPRGRQLQVRRPQFFGTPPASFRAVEAFGGGALSAPVVPRLRTHRGTLTRVLNVLRLPGFLPEILPIYIAVVDHFLKACPILWRSIPQHINVISSRNSAFIDQLIFKTKNSYKLCCKL